MCQDLCAQSFRAFRSNGALGIVSDNALIASIESRNAPVSFIHLGSVGNNRTKIDAINTLVFTIIDSISINSSSLIPDSLYWTCIEFEDGTRFYSKSKNSVQQNKVAVISLKLNNLQFIDGTKPDVSVVEKQFSNSNVKTIFLYGGSKSSQLTWNISPSTAEIYKQLVHRFELWRNDIYFFSSEGYF